MIKNTLLHTLIHFVYTYLKKYDLINIINFYEVIKKWKQ